MVTPGFQDPQRLGTPGDRAGATTVRGPGETRREGDSGSTAVSGEAATHPLCTHQKNG